MTIKGSVKPSREKFIAEYLKTNNATQAAISAGYSPKTAAGQGARLCKDVKIQCELERRRVELRGEMHLDAQTVLFELLRIGRADLKEAVNPDGTVKSLHEMPEDVRRAISGLDVEEIYRDGERIGRVKKVRFWSKPQTLETLARHLGLLHDNVNVNVDGLAEKLIEGARRAASKRRSQD